MLNFIDTNTFKQGVTINVLLYYKDLDRARNKLSKLTNNETVIKHIKTKSYEEAIVYKNGINIKLTTVPLTDSSRGYRSQYALVDKTALEYEDILDRLNTLVYAKNYMYSHLLNDESKESFNGIGILLY